MLIVRSQNHYNTNNSFVYVDFFQLFFFYEGLTLFVQSVACIVTILMSFQSVLFPLQVHFVLVFVSMFVWSVLLIISM